MRPAISTQSLALGYGDKLIINEMNIEIPHGKITVFIGANGCGKSTLLRSVARLLKPHSGSVLLEGKAISSMASKDIARKMAILPQAPQAPEGLTVYQLVKQGRYPYQSWLKQWSSLDEEKVQKAIESTNLTGLKDQVVDELSGGQKQRAWIAMTLAQDTDIILLDEPTTYLDMAHQIDILDLLFELNDSEKRTIVMVLHDLNLACRYADNLVSLKDGKIFTQGRPEDIITPEMVYQVFGMKCQIARDPIFGSPICIPFGKGRYAKKSAEVLAHA
ncbi:ABC transporter ATP-binding protein [Peribacillus sp. NPDC097284]|uniref:ABC transporter ATP-binding protein n=1 Tax=Peribacillus sp. NPDC097284 TaxID=3364401 RepID=UPI00380557E7